MSVAATLKISEPDLPHGEHYSVWDAVLASLRAQSPAGRAAVDHDWQRIEKAVYGQYHFSQPAGAFILDIGVGSGVTAFRFACTAAGRYKVVCVVTNEDHRAQFQKIADHHKLGNISFYANLPEAEKASEFPEKKINFLRVEKSAFSLASLEHIFSQYKIGIVYGEYDEPATDTAALALYRLCAVNAASFYWYNSVRRDIIAGDFWEGPEVSIIVSVHGQPKHLAECLESLVAQSLAAKEIIIVDDGSCSESGILATSYAQKHPEVIRVIRKDSGTRAATCDTGLQAAKGQYIIFFNGNDYAEPEMLEKLYEAAALYRTEIARCSFHIKGETAPSLEDKLVEQRQIIPKTYKLIDHKPFIGRYLYRRDFLTGNKISFVADLPEGEEMHFHGVSLFAASRVIALPEAFYVMHTDNNSQTCKNIFKAFDLLKKKIAASGNFFSESGLKKLQLRMHTKALAAMPEDERRLYLKQALNDITEGNCYVTRFDILRMAANISWSAVWLALRALVFG